MRSSRRSRAHTRRRDHGAFARLEPSRRVLAFAVSAAFTASAVPAFANPSGGSVASGSASFATSGKTLTITNTPGAIINWQQFSIQKDEITRFIQQNAASSVLNRVISQNPSVILGQLHSNGRVFLINPSGIAFGQGAVIDVAGFAASTLNISDSDFISGRMRFLGSGAEGKLSNAGTIRTAEGGHVYLIAPSVENQKSGVITSPNGEVVIAAGRTVELVNSRTPDLRVEFAAPDNQAVNAGDIVAASGSIGIYGTLVRSSGRVSAGRAELGPGGKIVFKATDTTLVSGTVEAKAEAGKGGEIQILGRQVGLVDQALVDASGELGGGTVLIGGDFQGRNANVQNAENTHVGRGTVIRADAITEGDGGKVIVWSDDTTTFEGSLSARGGLHGGHGGLGEISGKRHLAITGSADLSASHGKAGTLFLDPGTVTLCDEAQAGCTQGAPDTFTDAFISTTLDTGASGTNVTILTSAAANAGAENIDFRDATISIAWAKPSALAFVAGDGGTTPGDITVRGAISGSDAASSLSFGFGGTLDLSGATALAAGTVSFTGAGTGSTLVARNIANAWVINSSDGGTLNGHDFSAIGNLTGGSDDDTFAVQTGGSVSGTVAGGAGANTLDYAVYSGTVAVSLANSSATGIKGAAASGFSDIQSLVGNDGASGTDTTLTGPSAGSTYNLTGANSGDIGGTFAFSGVGNLTDSGAGVFNMHSGADGSVSGNLGAVAGTVDYTGYTSAPTFDLGGGASTGMGGWTGISTVTGRAASDGTISGSAKTYNLTSLDAGDNGVVSWTKMGNLADAGGGTFNITTGSLSGTLDGGTGSALDYSGFVGTVAVNAAGTATNVGGGFSNIVSLVGNGADTTLTGSGTFTVDGVNSGNLNTAFAFSSVANLAGEGGSDSFRLDNGGGAASLSGTIDGAGGTNTLDYAAYSGTVAVSLANSSATGIKSGTASGFSSIQSLSGNDGISGTDTTLAGPSAGSTYNLTGANSGDVGGAFTFSGVGNLTDSGAGVFNMHSGADGGVSGNLSAVGGTVDYTGYTSAPTFDLGGGASTGLGGWTGITAVTGRVASDGTITGSADTYNLTSLDAGDNGVVSWTKMGNLADAGGGTFRVTTGSLSGTVDGGTGSTLDYSGFVDTVTVNAAGTATNVGGGFSNIASLVGNGADTTLTGSGAFTVDGVDSGNLNATFAFSSVANLAGEAGNDSFRLDNGGGTASLSGTIDGAGGTNTLDYADYSGTVAVSLANSSATGIKGDGAAGFSNIQALVGNDGTSGTNATLTGTDAGSTYTVDQANAGNVDGTFAFSAVGNLTGGTGADVFALVNDGTTTHGALSGAINGGTTASNTLDYSGTSGTVAVGLASASSGSATNVTGGFSNIQSLVGNDGTSGTNTTLTGTDTGSTYTIHQANAGDVDGTFAFSAVGNLTGGAGADVFALVNDGTATHGALSGAINGGATGVNTLDYSGFVGAVAVNAAGTGASVAGGFSNIGSLVGNGADTTLTGSGTFTIDGADSGDLNATLAFSSVANLAGEGGNDIFKLDNGGGTASLSGALDGAGGTNTLDYADYSGAVAVNAAGTATNVGGGFSNIASLVGNGAGTTLTGSGIFTVDGANSGDLNTTFAFSSVANLAGEGGNDTFKLDNGGGAASLSGTINGGGGTNTLDYAAYSGPIAVGLASASSGSATDVTGGFSNIQSLVGNDATSGTNTTLIGTDAGSTYTVNQANAGNVDGTFAFSAVSNLTGGTGSDTFALVNDGTTTHGVLSGAINGGATGLNALDYGGFVGTVTVNAAGTATNVGGGFSNIASLVGNGADTTLTGSGAFTVDGVDSGNLNATFAFSSVANLAGEAGNDSFRLDNGGGTASLSGTIDGAGGTNTLDYTDYSGTVAVSLANSSATGIKGAGANGFSSIQSLVGNDDSGATATTTLTGTDTGSTYTVDQANAGNVNGTFAFSATGNLTGGSDDDAFVVAAGGSVSGTITGGGFTTADTLDYGGRSTTVSVTLTSTAAGQGSGTDVFAFTGINSLIGSSATDNTLTGPNAATNWHVTGADGGNLNSQISFSAFANLSGGTAADDFVFADGSLTGFIDGGAGANTLSIDVGSATIGGDIGDMSSITVATTGTAAFQGQVTAGSVTVTNSAGTTFQGSLTASNVTLTSTTGTIAFHGDTTVNSGLTTAANGYNVSLVGSSNSIAGTTTFNNAGTLTLGDGGDTIAFIGGVVATAPSSKTVNGTVSAAGTGVIDLGASAVDVAGSSTIGGTSTGQITLGAATLADGVTLTLGAGAATPISASSISGTPGGTASNLTIASSGLVTVGGAVGTDIGTVTLNNTGGTVAFQGDTTVSAGLTTAAGAYNVSFTGSSTSIAGTTTFNNTGTLTLGNGGDTIAFTGGVIATAPSSKTVNGTVSAAGTGVIDLGTSAVDVAGSSTIGGTSTGQITLGAATLADGVTLTLGAGAATPISASSISGTPGGTASNLTIASSGLVTVSGAVGTDIGTVTLNNTGGTVAFQSDFSAGTLVTAGNAYNLDFLGATTQIGSATNFLNTGRVQLGDQTTDAITIGGALTHTNAGLTRLAGTIGVSGVVNLNATDMPGGQLATVNAGANAVTFHQTVEGPGGLAVNTSGTTTFTGTIGLAGPLASLEVGGGGATQISGGLVNTTSGQTYADAVSVDGPTTFTSGASGNILFSSSLTGLTGPHDLTVASGGTFSVSGALTGIDNLGVTANGDVTLASTGNVVAGAVTFTTTSAGSVDYYDSNAISLGASDIAGSARIVSGDGGIATTGAVTTGGGIALVANDVTGGNTGTIVIGGTLTTHGQTTLNAADDITVNGQITTNNNHVDIVAGNSDGVDYGAIRLPSGTLAAREAATGDNHGAVHFAQGVDAGTGNIVIVTAGDAGTVAQQSNVTQSLTGALVSSNLTVVTLKGPGGLNTAPGSVPGGDIILNTSANNDNANVRFFACGSAGCPTPALSGPTVPVVFAAANEYAAGQIAYSGVGGVNLAGLGTVGDFSSFVNGPFTLTANPFSAGNVTIESDDDIIIDLNQNLLRISGDPTKALTLKAKGNIRYVNQAYGDATVGGGTIGTSSTPFNNHLNMTAAGSILLENHLYQNTQNLLLAANTGFDSTFQPSPVLPSGTGDVTLQGNYTVRTGGNVTVKGRDFSLLGGDIGGYFQSAAGQELIAAGTISLQNTGVVRVKAGTAVADGAKDPLDTNLYPSGSGARLQGGTVNIGSASTPADNPTLLIVEGGSNNVGVATSNTSSPDIELNQANAVVRSNGAMSIYLRKASYADTASLVTVPSTLNDDYSLVVRGGSVDARNSGTVPLFVTALGALQAGTLTLQTQGTILFQGGTTDLRTASTFAASSALLLVQNEKAIAAGGSVVLIGGNVNVNANDAVTLLPLTSTSAGNAVSIAQLDPSKLTMTVGGILVLQGGKTTGPQGALASARIDAGDEIKIIVNGTKPYTYTPSSGPDKTLGPASFFMIGGSDSGFFDTNNIDLAGSLPYPQAFPVTVALAGNFLREVDLGLASGVVQTGLATFDDSLLSYIIFAANEETRALRIRRGFGDGEDVGAPACR